MVLTDKKRKEKLQNCLHFWNNYEVKIAPVARLVYTDYIK